MNQGEYKKDVYELSITAIREMIANAVIHRSYLDRSCVQVYLYDGSLEVSSPGMLYGGLDFETAKLGKSTYRSEAIAEAFRYMYIVEEWGTGLPRIINRCKEYRLPDPLFDEFGDGFKVTLFRKVSNEPVKVSNAFGKYAQRFEEASVTEVFARNIESVFDNCGISVPFGQDNVMEWLDCSKSKATNLMNAMKAAKIISKVNGMGPGKYEFVEL